MAETTMRRKPGDAALLAKLAAAAASLRVTAGNRRAAGSAMADVIDGYAAAVERARELLRATLTPETDDAR